MIVRFRGDPAAVRDGVARVWKQIAPDVPFSAEFSEDRFKSFTKRKMRERKYSPLSRCSR